MSDREIKLFNLLLKIGISSKRLLDDTKRIVEELHNASAEHKLKFLHQLILLGSTKQRDPQDYFLLSQAAEMLSKVNFLKDRGYDKIAKDLEEEAWNIIFTIALKWGPSFARRLFLSEDIVKKEEVEEL